MAVTRWGFELGASGDALGATNANADSVTATGGTATIATAQKFENTRSALMTATSTSGGVYLQKGITATTQLAVDAFIYITALPNAETTFLWMGSGTTRQCSVSIGTTGTVIIRDGSSSSGAILWTSTATMATSTWYRISLFATQNASTGTVRATLYTGNSASTTADSTLLTAQNTGSASYDTIRIGVKTVAATTTMTAYVDYYGYDPAASDVLGPAAQSLFNTFEGGTDNTDLSAANTTGNSGVPIASVAKNTGTTLQFSVAQARGTLSMRISYALSAAGYAIWNWASSNRTALRFYLYYENNFDTTTMEIMTFRAASANLGKISLTGSGSTRAFVIQNAAATVVAGPPYQLQANSWYRIEAAITVGTTTSNGRIEFAYYDSDSLTPIYSYDSGATANTGTAAFATIRLGSSNGPVTQTLVTYYDDLAIQELTSGFIGPSVPGTTYIASQFMPFFH